MKDAETRYAEKLGDIKKQLDNRWKQIDKFEGSLKTYADTKSTWRRKMNAKDGEIEAMRVRSVILLPNAVWVLNRWLIRHRTQSSRLSFRVCAVQELETRTRSEHCRPELPTLNVA